MNLGRSGEIGNEVCRVWRAKTSNRVPAYGRRVSGNRWVRLVVAAGDVEEVVGVLSGVGRDRVQRGVDETQAAALDLVGERHEAGPLRAAKRGAADVVPAGATGCATGADQTAVAVRWKRDVDEGARSRAGLQADVRNASHGPDRGAAR